MTMNNTILAALALVGLAAGTPCRAAEAPPQAEKAAGPESPSSRLYLELVKTESLPVIGVNHPDTWDIRGGFEAGTTVKLTIDGKTAYHMVTSTLETPGWSRMRTEHWVSEDGMNWARHNILFRPRHHPETGLWELTGSPFFFFDEARNRWFLYFNYMAFSRVSQWRPPCLLRRSAARTEGLAGIQGEFEFPGEIVAPSGIAHPTDVQSSSISPPFQAADGKWYAFLGGGPKPFNEKSGKWWVLIVKAKGPEGPFVYMPEHAPEPFMEPTGYVENPMVTKIKGPITGRDYWTVIFNYLKPEVTTKEKENSQIGFSSSLDGLTWPVQNAQLLDMEAGLPSGVQRWWRCIRVPHQLVEEGNGIYTCFFSAYDREGEFESIGKATFRVKEVLEK